MYHPVPLPIQYKDDTIVLITPEIDCLALSNSNENFFSLNGKQWEKCIRLESYTLCKGDQPIQRRTRSNLCEVAQLSNKISLPKDCKIKMATLATSIWHRLLESNSWLFYTQSEICTELLQPQIVEITGVGSLTTSCEILTDYFRLLPLSKTNRR